MVRPSNPDITWRLAAFTASSAAAGVHFGAAADHLSEWAPAGIFMLVAGSLQLIWALAVACGRGPGVATAGALINSGIIAIWLISRTLGVPFGPMAGVREHIHAGDALATGLEILVVVAVIRMRWELRAPGILIRLALFGAVCTAFATTHGTTHERAIPVATLVLATTVWVYVTQFAVHVGRNHVRIPSLRTRPGYRPVPGASLGAG